MILRIQRPAPSAAFVHPLDPPPRTAILVPGFRESKMIRVFPNGWSDEVARYAPEAVAGTFLHLRDLAKRGIELTHAVIVLSWSLNEVLEGVQRDFLWRSFGVPVYQQVLRRNNSLRAYECDAHSGLHVLDASTTNVDVRACPCGSEIPLYCPAPKLVTAVSREHRFAQKQRRRP